ncbi:hypothetical protein Pla110_22410 [Polystyrenella longa]|uniref:Uncharacterized protein n=1 Tax=Polystyrenella longa TaxID=2528007 RepID=A0A518CMR2_9PLAN|nr:hypothetical protein [Polystyrenella longa]QDU80511.1 hypothetical protein Pla110_22410 [Polystyrenella longa]
MSNKSQVILDKIIKEARSEDPKNKVRQIIDRWKNQIVTLGSHGKWNLEGFVMIFAYIQELSQEVDPSFPKRLPPQCFDPVSIAKRFDLKEEEFSHFQSPSNNRVAEVLEGVQEKLLNLTSLIDKALPVLDERCKVDPSTLSDTQLALYKAADDTPQFGKQICKKAGVSHHGTNRGHLAHLVEIGLLNKTRGGYVRAPSRQMP